ncbi:methyltransferase domain-containing protein [Haloplanus rubicundus]|uniref:Methyltransferase domain-containing protein n=1 Tax=Haloplanus rubicundus TaxID=1547898 RepID=A0A345DZG0_9EURY|nr:methyltransferase domain-containing protein [Haloplanus rubicundus]AXG05332.1 methyltransferase domain-containing protein [Haloplanus rubicundus]
MDILSALERQKQDNSDDSRFYDSPRYVTHADEAFCQRLTTLYDRIMAPGDRVFDAMGSWVSHFPKTDLGHVVGHGLNVEELAANDRYDEWIVQNFNEEQSLSLADDAFDVVCCALSVQYLQHPEAVFSEFGRILDDDGAVVVSFTNRMFPTKAIRAWRLASMDGRAELVASYLQAGGLSVTDRIAEGGAGDPFYAVVGQPESTQ